MGGTDELQQKLHEFPPVLLCFPGNASAASKLLEDRYCGKPLLFHQLLHFHELGARDILLSVEAMPGALVTVIDELDGHGVRVKFVRSAAEVLSAMGQQRHLVVAKADVWFNDEIFKESMMESGNRLFTVEERPENQLFERIDLNSRWLGLGRIDRKILESIHDLPSDWDMASSILRQALQQAPILDRLRQSDLTEGHAVHLLGSWDYQSLFPNDQQPKGAVEDILFNAFTKKIARHAWQSPNTRNLAVWAFPAMALVCISLATMGQFMAAALVAIIGAWAADIRSYVLAAEYQKRRFDLLTLLAWILLGCSLAAVLYLDGVIAFDAVLFAGVVSGLSLQSKKLSDKIYLSPILIGMVILLGVTTGTIAISVKLLIAAQLIALLAGPMGKSAPSLKAN
jgi:hypothetical protein